MKLSNIVPIVILSLIAWLLFYLAKMPLDAEATVAVVAICAAALFAFKWVKKRLKKEGKSERKD